MAENAGRGFQNEGHKSSVRFEELRFLAARWKLGHCSERELIQFAEDALVNGSDEPALVELAGLGQRERFEAGFHFVRVLETLGLPVPTEDLAAITMAEYHARAIVSGEVSPYEGCDRIVRDAWRSTVVPELVVFVLLLEEIEELLPNVVDKDIEAKIRREAIAFLG